MIHCNRVIKSLTKLIQLVRFWKLQVLVAGSILPNTKEADVDWIQVNEDFLIDMDIELMKCYLWPRLASVNECDNLSNWLR